MELTELKFLGAATLLGGAIEYSETTAPRLKPTLITPDKYQISAAVAVAQDIWEEVIRQDRL